MGAWGESLVESTSELDIFSAINILDDPCFLNEKNDK